jgi:hypothetical protein
MRQAETLHAEQEKKQGHCPCFAIPSQVVDTTTPTITARKRQQVSCKVLCHVVHFCILSGITEQAASDSMVNDDSSL